MKSYLTHSRKQFWPTFYSAKSCSLFVAVLFCICSGKSLIAHPVNKIKKGKGDFISSATKRHVLSIKNFGSPTALKRNITASPALSYAGPQVYTAGTAITPLTPTGGVVAVPGYSTSTTILGSGFNIPAGLAVDGKGNVFVGDQNNNDVKEIPGGLLSSPQVFPPPMVLPWMARAMYMWRTTAATR